MMENKCSKCGNDVDITFTARTKEGEPLYDITLNDVVDIENKEEHWCFDCLRQKIVWPESHE